VHVKTRSTRPEVFVRARGRTMRFRRARSRGGDVNTEAWSHARYKTFVRCVYNYGCLRVSVATSLSCVAQRDAERTTIETLPEDAYRARFERFTRYEYVRPRTSASRAKTRQEKSPWPIEYGMRKKHVSVPKRSGRKYAVTSVLENHK